MATIALEKMVFYARHGVFKEEHTLGNRFEVSVYFEIDLKPEIVIEDSIRHTVDYGKVYQLVEEQMRINRKLLETLAVSISQKILQEFLMVNKARVRVTKFNPPINGVCDYVYVEYEGLR